MSRRRRAKKHVIQPDAVYGDKKVTKFINMGMKDGKKSTFERVVYQSFDEIKKETGEDPLKVFHKAIDEISPVYEVRPRRVGGATYQVPLEVDKFRAFALAVRWLMDATNKRSEKRLAQRLAKEIVDAYRKAPCRSLKKLEEVRKMVEAAKVFAHLVR